MKQRAIIRVNGIVQGVGFRPFVYRVARNLSLTGYVLNLGDAGVRIVAEGEKKQLEKLIQMVKSEPPSISRVDEISVQWEKFQNDFDEFLIEKSSETRTEDVDPIIPPDIAICGDCKRDLFDEASRWYRYPFTSCAACGPRYSTITTLPYDRPNTTMVDFPLCNTCNIGYTDPLDRRYHAQTTACEDCGPQYKLVDKSGNSLELKNSIKKASELIACNKILAVQGISGTHLVTGTRDYRPIEELRERKKRSARPFAIMVRDEDTLLNNFDITEMELDLIKSWRRPIVLVRKKSVKKISVLQLIPQETVDLIAPGLDTVGVMLPYAPVHLLLFDYLDEPALIMTSANPTGIPMYIDSDALVSELHSIADYFLVHDRRIHQREDDSVIKVINDSTLLIRRARGYVPEPLTLKDVPKHHSVLAVGPEEKVTGSLVRSGRVYPTQYIGNTDRIENVEFLKDALNHLMSLIGLNTVDAVACDLHPEFLTTSLAEHLSETYDANLHRVQHHHAHLASHLVEYKLPLNTRIICITADGFGYGDDGNAWGGEILLGDAKQYDRIGGIKPYDFPGGNLTAQYAIRPFIGFMADDMNADGILNAVTYPRISKDRIANEEEVSLLLTATKRKINTVTSSSAGRFLDTVALVLGICDANTYDGECPMKLEAIARESTLRIPSIFSENNGQMQLDVRDAIQYIIDLRRGGEPVQDIAYAAQWYLGSSLVDIAVQNAKQYAVRHIGFSGGVALNRIITRAIVSKIKDHGLTPLIHRDVPPGDGGVSIGQAAVAIAREIY